MFLSVITEHRIVHILTANSGIMAPVLQPCLRVASCKKAHFMYTLFACMPVCTRMLLHACTSFISSDC